jgi:hypothetical protein
LAEIVAVARFSWDENSRDACSLGGWAPAKEKASGSGAANSSVAPSGNSRPSSGQMAGSKRPRSNSRHYRKQFSEFEQLRFWARAMEGTRVAFRSHFALKASLCPLPLRGRTPSRRMTRPSRTLPPSMGSWTRPKARLRIRARLSCLPGGQCGVTPCLPWIKVDAVRPGLAPS